MVERISTDLKNALPPEEEGGAYVLPPNFPTGEIDYMRLWYRLKSYLYGDAKELDPKSKIELIKKQQII